MQQPWLELEQTCKEKTLGEACLDALYVDLEPLPLLYCAFSPPSFPSYVFRKPPSWANGRWTVYPGYLVIQWQVLWLHN